MGFVEILRNMIRKEEEPVEQTGCCTGCGYEFPETSMVMIENYLLCHDCNDKRKQKEAEAKELAQKAKSDEKTKFHCYNCKFKFARKSTFNVKLCPNCGSENFTAEGRFI